MQDAGFSNVLDGKDWSGTVFAPVDMVGWQVRPPAGLVMHMLAELKPEYMPFMTAGLCSPRQLHSAPQPD